jgi:Fur family ferric uptake transcriptional regulator
VLQVLADGGHHAADDVVAALQQTGPSLQRGSVYNVLATLLAHGLVMMADAGPGRALYELNRGWHHHFVCLSCGGVWDVPCQVGSKPCLEPPDLDAEVDEAQVIFRGRCADCRAADRPRRLPQGSLE